MKRDINYLNKGKPSTRKRHQISNITFGSLTIRWSLFEIQYCLLLLTTDIQTFSPDTTLSLLYCVHIQLICNNKYISGET